MEDRRPWRRHDPRSTRGWIAHRAGRRASRGCRRRGRCRLGSVPAAGKWPLKVTNDSPDKDGWSNIARLQLPDVSQREARRRRASARRAGDVWTVVIYDMAQAVGEKRAAQVASDLQPPAAEGLRARDVRGQEGARARRGAHRRADAVRRDAGRRQLGVPGVVDRHRAGRQGRLRRRLRRARARQGPAKPDADTLYMIASNTKALTTLLLAKLVDEGKLTWETPVTQVLPAFKLGDADTTSRVLVKHLICACTGLPRQDFEWLFAIRGRHAGRRARDARHDAADQQVRRDVPVLEPAGRRRQGSSAVTWRFRSSSSAPPTTRRCRRGCSIRSA